MKINITEFQEYKVVEISLLTSSHHIQKLINGLTVLEAMKFAHTLMFLTTIQNSTILNFVEVSIEIKT